MDVTFDGSRTRLNAWAEWERQEDAVVFSIKAEWKRDMRFIVNLRIRGRHDAYPWKQMIPVRPDGHCGTLGVEDFIANGESIARFEIRDKSTREEFEKACQNAHGMVNRITGDDACALPGFAQHTIPVVMDFRHIRDDMHVVANPSNLKGLLCPRTLKMTTSGSRELVYPLRESEFDCTQNLIVTESLPENSQTRRTSIPLHLFGDSDYISLTSRLSGKNDVPLLNFDGNPVKDEVERRIVNLYNSKQDVDFEEEVVAISCENNISCDKLFDVLCGLYRLAIFNDMEWLKCMLSLFLLNKYRNSDKLCDLYKFYHGLRQENASVEFEIRVLHSTIQRLVKSYKTCDESLADAFLDKAAENLQMWQRCLWNEFAVDFAKKRRREP
eukprot:gene591-994_t